MLACCWIAIANSEQQYRVAFRRQHNSEFYRLIANQP